MAKALFFIEALVVAALAVVMPILAADLRDAFLAPIGVALLLPLAASLAVRPFAEMRSAFACAFLGKRAVGKAAVAPRVFAELADFALFGGALGIVASLILAASRLGQEVSAGHWLMLGAFTFLFGLLAAMAARILRSVVERGLEPFANADTGTAAALAFAARYGLTPREWEVAAIIAGGATYKEAASDLGISIKTVKTHITSAYRKTGTGDKVAFILLLRAEKGKE